MKIELILTAIALMCAILEVIIHFRKGELQSSPRFPFIRIVSKKRHPDKHIEELPQKRGIKKAFIPISIVTLIFVVILARIVFFHEATAAIRRPIAVMLFKNQTGETKFDYLCEAIPNLLITNLEQSKHLSVMTWERMYDLLKSMGKQDVQVIDEQIGFELCNRDGVNIIVLGTFTKAGETFVTDVKILDVQTKRMRYSTSSQGEGVASILKKQIDELSKKILHGIGLSERAVEEAKLLIADVTTNSMEAYNYYLQGWDAYEKMYYADAIKYLKKAIELDSTFAMAYGLLGTNLSILNEINPRNQAFKKAKEYANRATERERLYIEARYAANIQDDKGKAIRILQKCIEKYPKEKSAYAMLAIFYGEEKLTQAIEACNRAFELDPQYGPAINLLAYGYIIQGNYDKAIEYFKKYAALCPDDANPYDSMAELYFWIGKFDESITFYKQALEIKPSFGSGFQISYIYALQEEYPEALEWTDRYIEMAPSPGFKEYGYAWKSLCYYWSGNSARALKELSTAEDVLKEMGTSQLKADLEWDRVRYYLARKEFHLSRKSLEDGFEAALKVYPKDASSTKFRYSFYLGLIALNQGQVDSVRQRIGEMNSLLPKTDNSVLFVFCRDLLYVELLLAHDSTDKAVAVAKKTAIPMFSQLNEEIQEHLIAALTKDILARAYAKNGELDKAIAEYERFFVINEQNKNRLLIHPLYHYRLARLYEQKGLTAKAIMHYEKFIDLWKDTDYGIKELEDAKKRLDVLRQHV